MPSRKPAPPSVAVIQRLQNDVRRAVNFFPSGEKNLREGVEPTELRRQIGSIIDAEHAKRLTLRKARPSSHDEAEYALSYNGELLFRLVYVPWPTEFYGHEGRWHVRRHPEATWWRDKPKAQRPKTSGRR